MTSAQSCLHDNAHLCLRQGELATGLSRCRYVSSQETLNSVVLAGLISLSPQQADASVMVAMKWIEVDGVYNMLRCRGLYSALRSDRL